MESATETMNSHTKRFKCHSLSIIWISGFQVGGGGGNFNDMHLELLQHFL